jgi:hypothetical protein
MKRKLGKCQDGGQPQESQGNSPQDIIGQVAGMLQQGGNPMEVVTALMQQQMAPEEIMQILVQAGLPQEQAMQAVQQVMQEAQQGQQPQQGQDPNMQQAVPQEPPMMEFGGEFDKAFKQSLSEKLALPSSTSENYTDERFKVFSEAVRRNFAKSVLDKSNTFDPMMAELGLDMALKDFGVTKEQYDSNEDLRNRIEAYRKNSTEGSIGKISERFGKPSGTTATNSGINQEQINEMISKAVSSQFGNYYNQGNQNLPFYGYQDPRFATPNVNPFGRLVQQYFNNRQPQLTNVNFNGVPTDIDMQSIIDGTNPTYRLSSTENFKRRNGLFRKEKGVRFYLDPREAEMNATKDPYAVADYNDLSLMEQLQADQWSREQDAIRNRELGLTPQSSVTNPVISSQLNVNQQQTLSNTNPVVNENVSSLTAPEIEQNKKRTSLFSRNRLDVEGLYNEQIAKSKSKIKNIENLTRDDDRDGVPNYLDQDPNSTTNAVVNVKGVEEGKEGVPTSFEKDQALLNKDIEENFKLLKDLENQKLPFFGKKKYSTFKNRLEETLIQQQRMNKQLRDMMDNDKDGVSNYLDIDPNSTAGVDVDTKGIEIKNPQEMAIEKARLDPTVRFQESDMALFKEDPNRFGEQEVMSFDLNETGLGSKGLKVYQQEPSFMQGYYKDALEKFKILGRLPQRVDGGDVTFTYGNQGRFNPNDVADFSKNTLDQLSSFAEMVRQFNQSRNRENAFYSSANVNPQAFSEMSRGIYTDQGDFLPTDLGAQVLNPTNAFGDNSMNYMMANGGEVSFSPDELEILKKAGYKLK